MSGTELALESGFIRMNPALVCHPNTITTTMQHRRRNEARQEDSGALDLPQAFPDEDGVRGKVKVEEPQGKRKSRTAAQEGNNQTAWILTFGLLMVIVLVASYFLVSHHEQTQLDHLRQNIMHDQVEPLSREWEEKYSHLEEENQKLQQYAKEYETMKEENEKLRDTSDKDSDKREEEKERVEYLDTYKDKIQERIKLMSTTLLLEKFGPGPHHVEITVAFDPEFPKKEDSDTGTGRIVVELAPASEMPHVVYWFLEQVTRGLYDGCSFHRNAGHVVQGGPAPNFLSPPDPKLHKRFKDAGFYSILFQEYSPKFPHKKYTLGLAGRPGGPDFYISTRDNSRLHGPGGQTSYDDPSEADSCFAKVTEGFNVVDRMQLSPLKPGGYKAMTNNVAIVSMKWLEQGTMAQSSA